MNWKKPKTRIFFVPMPYTGQSLYSISEYRRNPEAEHQKIEFTDTDTKEPYTGRILDYLGSYEINQLPDWISRLTTDIELMTGEKLAAYLRKRIPAFKKSEIVLFYQMILN